MSLLLEKLLTTPHNKFSHSSSDIKKFVDVFSEKLPDNLPPICGIQHAIDFIPGVARPNLPHYIMNPSEQAELKSQVDELLSKGH